jgi:hypothetical protein
MPDGITLSGGAEVSVISLDDLLQRAGDHFRAETIDFVKIDIEGGEHEAILAASPRTLRRIRRLGMEYHPNCPKELLFNCLQSHGLKLEHDRIIGKDVGIAHFARD